MKSAYVALVVLAFVVAAPALILGFIVGALVAGLVVGFDVGRRAIMPAVSHPMAFEEDED